METARLPVERVKRGRRIGNDRHAGRCRRNRSGSINDVSASATFPVGLDSDADPSQQQMPRKSNGPSSPIKLIFLVLYYLSIFYLIYLINFLDYSSQAVNAFHVPVIFPEPCWTASPGSRTTPTNRRSPSQHRLGQSPIMPTVWRHRPVN